MDVEAMISDIDDHGFEDSSEERKLSVLNDVYHDVLSREPWPFLEKLDRDTDLTLSDDVLEASEAIRAVLMLRVLTRTVVPIRLDEFLRHYGHRSTQAGTPEFYYFVGNELRLWPIPAALPTGSTLAYLMRAEDLAAGTDEEDILLPREYHRDILVNGALYKLYALEDDAELASGFQRYFEEGLQRMREFVWKKQYQQLEIVEYPSW
jgi:hypothetical protein